MSDNGSDDIADRAKNCGFDYSKIEEFREALVAELERRFGKDAKYLMFIVIPGHEYDGASILSNMDKEYSAGLLYKALGRALDCD